MKFMFFFWIFLACGVSKYSQGILKVKEYTFFTIYGNTMNPVYVFMTYFEDVKFFERILKSCPYIKFFLILRKSGPNLSFWTKSDLSFCPKGKFWVFLAHEFLQKCWKKMPDITTMDSSNSHLSRTATWLATFSEMTRIFKISRGHYNNETPQKFSTTSRYSR